MAGIEGLLSQAVKPQADPLSEAFNGAFDMAYKIGAQGTLDKEKFDREAPFKRAQLAMAQTKIRNAALRLGLKMNDIQIGAEASKRASKIFSEYDGDPESLVPALLNDPVIAQSSNKKLYLDEAQRKLTNATESKVSALQLQTDRQYLKDLEYLGSSVPSGVDINDKSAVHSHANKNRLKDIALASGAQSLSPQVFDDLAIDPDNISNADISRFDSFVKGGNKGKQKAPVSVNDDGSVDVNLPEETTSTAQSTGKKKISVLPKIGKKNSGGTPKVTTQAEFNKLPSGTTYISKDGKTYKKP